ncbi:hypothetical protein N1851_004864 [Merluccius polli]|uniref:DUF5641 domain-containing protein n=1 Tax=Merluccius polli TaxID=89951 RepID=A0AA47N854_MERPO|nr:hypothetical protein N1851_004864 [Merluccius polli]
MIRLIRRVLSSVLRQQTLDDDGFHTMLCEVEAILNDRPITKLSDDPNDLEPLTPNHLLLLKGKPALPPGVFEPHDQYVKRRWRQIQYLADLFWKRWVREYLPLLQERQKWNQKKRSLVVGDIVTIMDASAPRGSWPLGKVLEVFPDKYGLVRSVKLQTKSNIIERPVTKLTLLHGRVMELEADAMGHKLLFVDEAGFNLSKTRRRGRNIIGHRAIINVPGQRGGNITMCAAISQNGVVHHHATTGPYNSAHMIAFLDTLHDILTVQRPEQTRYVVIWDNVSFHRAALVRNWFTDHPLFMALNLPPYSPFLNPIEEFFSAWRWKVHDRHPHQHAALLQAMEEACGDIEQASCQAWIRHARRYFPRCLGLEDIACDVDEILWPDPERRHDVG